MKKAFFIFLSMSILNTVFGQTNTNLDTDLIFIDPEIPATYPGGTSQLNKYISDNVTYKINFTNDEAVVLRKVIAKFIIDEYGSTDSVSILRTSNIPRLDSLFVSALKKMPKWTPAKLGGKTIRQKWTYPLQICLK
jgi:periplasmic protein TonB